MHHPNPTTSRLLSGLSASFPIVVLLLLAPIELYGRNVSLIDLPAASVSYCAAAAGVLVLLTLTAFLATRRDRQVAASRSALLGLIFLGFHFLRPTYWNLNAPTRLLSERPVAAFVEAALVIVLIIAWMRMPLRWHVLLGAGLTMAGIAVSAGLFWNIERAANPVANPPAAAIARPNVYHILFDGFATPAFAPALKKGMADDLSGFILYRRNRANYLATDASLPSLLSGQFFTGGDFELFQRQARDGGIRAALKAQGYSVATYTPDRNRFWHFASADRVTTNQDLARERFDPSGAISLGQMSIVSCMPPFLRKPALFLLRLIVPDSGYRKYKQYSVDLIDRFLADEARRPASGQYVYIHILLPHPPYRYNAQCTLERGTASYKSQAVCATMQMVRIAKRLREVGHFDRSLILFHSDHGFDRARSGLESGRANLPRPVTAAIVKSGEQFTPQEIMERAQALLIVKPVGAARHPLHISCAPTQLVDIPATIADAVGLNVKSGRGVPFRTLANTSPRVWHLFTGLQKQGGLFQPNHDGAGIAHIAREAGGRWQVYPYIRPRPHD